MPAPSGVPDPKSASGAAKRYSVAGCKAGIEILSSPCGERVFAAALRVVEAARVVDDAPLYCFADPTHPDRIAFERSLEALSSALSEWGE